MNVFRRKYWGDTRIFLQSDGWQKSFTKEWFSAELNYGLATWRQFTYLPPCRGTAPHTRAHQRHWHSDTDDSGRSGEGGRHSKYLCPSTNTHTHTRARVCELKNRGTGKENVLHMHNGALLSHEKEWDNAICQQQGWTQKLSYWVNQPGKDKYHAVSLICGN